MPLQNLPNDTIPSKAEELELLKTLPVDDLINQVISRVVHFTIQVAIAIVVFYAGKFLIKKIHSILGGIFYRRHVDPSLATFLLSMVRIVLYFMLIVIVVGILGIETSSFIALFASAGVAIGMALSGTLQNFAGGVLILLLKPYKVGDYIEAQGYAGTVSEIQIFHTIINTYDNKSIIIPNGGLSTGSINNWNREDYRRVDWTVSVSYGNDFDTVRQALLDILSTEPDIVRKYIEDDREERAKAAREAGIVTEEPEAQTDAAPAEDQQDESAKRSWLQRLLPRRRSKTEKMIERRAKTIVRPKVDRSPVVVLDNLGSSSVDLKVRAWAPTKFYWQVFYRINSRIYKELPRPGIAFPFPQMDVHITKEINPNGKTI